MTTKKECCKLAVLFFCVDVVLGGVRDATSRDLRERKVREVRKMTRRQKRRKAAGINLKV